MPLLDQMRQQAQTTLAPYLDEVATFFRRCDFTRMRNAPRLQTFAPQQLEAAYAEAKRRMSAEPDVYISTSIPEPTVEEARQYRAKLGALVFREAHTLMELVVSSMYSFMSIQFLVQCELRNMTMSDIANVTSVGHARAMIDMEEEEAKRLITIDPDLVTIPPELLSLREHGVINCAEDLEQFVGHTFHVQDPISNERTSFCVDAVNHTTRRGTQVQITYADGDKVVLTARECDSLMDTVIE